MRVRKTNALPERDVHLMLEESTAISGCIHKLIRIRKLAALHKIEQMLRVQMLEQHAAWKRESGFDRIEIIAERRVETLRHLYAGYDSEPFHVGLYDA